MRNGLGLRAVGRSRHGAVAVVLVAAVGLVSALTAVPASAATHSKKVHPLDAGFTIAPVVGVRSSGTDSCSVGPVSGTNCTATIVLHGTALPTTDASTIGTEQSGAATNVTVVDNDDCTFCDHGWQAGHDTDSVTTCDVIVGDSTATTLILEVGDLGALCPGYAIAPGDSVKVILYNSDGSTFDTETTTATTPGTEPAVSDVNPPTGPVGGGTDAAPGTGTVTVTTSDTAAPEAVWFTNPSGLTGATGIATDSFTNVDPTHYTVVPPASGTQGNEGIVVEVADSANGTSPQACAVLLPTGCADEYMYMNEHSNTFGPSDPFNINWSATIAQSAAADSSACGVGSSSGLSAGLSVGGSVTGGGIGLTASYGVSDSEAGFPETIVGSATLTVASPIVVTVSLTGGVSGCEQIPIPDLAIPDVAGFYFVVGGSISGSATLTITIDQGTYTLAGSVIPGPNADDKTGATVTANCVDGSGNPTTDCVTTALSASLTGTLTVSPLWLQVGPSFANIGAGLTAAATGTITVPPLAVDGDICVAGNWIAQVNLGPLNVNTGGNWLGPFNVAGDGTICPLGATTGSTSTAPGAPTGLTGSGGDSSATVNWTAPASDGGSAITGYNVYEGTSPGAESATPVNATPLPATPTSYQVTGLTNGTTYYFTVKAVNGIGEGSASNEATVPAGVAGPGIVSMIDGSGNAYVKVGALTSPWTKVASGVTAIAVATDATNGPLIGIINANGFYVKQGSLTGTWTHEGAAGTTAISVATDATNGPLLGMLNANGFYVKQGSLTGTWTHEGATGTTAISVATDATDGPLLGMTNANGFYVKDGSLTGVWTHEASIGAQSIEVATDATHGSLIGLLDVTGIFSVKQGTLTGKWTKVATDVTGMSIATDATNGPLIGIINANGFYLKQGSLTGTWTHESAAGTTAISVATDATGGPLFALINASGIYAKLGSLTGTWSHVAVAGPTAIAVTG